MIHRKFRPGIIRYSTFDNEDELLLADELEHSGSLQWTAVSACASPVSNEDCSLLASLKVFSAWKHVAMKLNLFVV